MSNERTLLNPLGSQRPKGDPLISLMNDCSISSEKLATFTLGFFKVQTPKFSFQNSWRGKKTLDSVLPIFQFSGTHLPVRCLWEEHAAVLTCDTPRNLTLKFTNNMFFRISSAS